MQGSVSYHAGQAAENAVARDYIRRGFTLARERWRGKRGEIDLIMRDGPDLVFVEVKKSTSFEQAALRITRRQIDRILGSAEEFIANEPNGSLTNLRFDVALVDETGQLRIVENAFGHD
ncbi:MULTISPECIES: YraN family protein [unclassified Sulfitobacter]|uniref:YraN family protein n=1 Tax=unclassified Sulfitobacter TaxID=196795 RepID=UPI0015946083|nr:YraN family protein [Sulfitobacter sp. HGT1]MBQ0804229.1 YraN family protein [Sulfitobacter sp.]